MRNQLGLGVLGTAGLGAGLMFLLDPDMGTRRRAILRDKLISVMRLTAWAADKTSRDVKNRLYGTVHSTKSLFSETAVSDDVLVERVRSQMGRAISHPHAIHVTAQNGWVTLTGEILSGEVSDLVRTVSSVKGVTEVVNRLKAHDEPGEISGLQGGHIRHGSRFGLLQSNWPPAIRLTVGAAGLITTSTGIKQGGVLGSILAGIGTGMVLLAITNQNVRQMIERASAVAEKRGTTITFPTRLRKSL
jgi:hypothetical protein